jgi:hypothetical protein
MFSNAAWLIHHGALQYMCGTPDNEHYSKTYT